MKKALDNYKKECQFMADTFIEWYFCDDDIKPSDVDAWWVADQVGGVLYVNDFFWNMNDLVEIFKEQPTPEQLFKWKYETDEAYTDGKPATKLSAWLKLSQ